MASQFTQHRHKAMRSCGLFPEFGGISWQTRHTTHTEKEFYLFILVLSAVPVGQENAQWNVR